MTKTSLVPAEIKPKMKSKTLWLHGISLTVGLLSIVAGADMIAEQPFWLGVIIAIQGALGIGLRFLTTQPIK